MDSIPFPYNWLPNVYAHLRHVPLSPDSTWMSYQHLIAMCPWEYILQKVFLAQGMAIPPLPSMPQALTLISIFLSHFLSTLLEDLVSTAFKIFQNLTTSHHPSTKIHVQATATSHPEDHKSLQIHSLLCPHLLSVHPEDSSQVLFEHKIDSITFLINSLRISH
jgi:hypothetical protein